MTARFISERFHFQSILTLDWYKRIDITFESCKYNNIFDIKKKKSNEMLPFWPNKVECM